MRHFFLLIVLCFVLPGMVSVVAGQRSMLPYTQYTIREGLAQQQVRAFWEDPLGYIWIGTNGGISRFDGRTLTPMDKLGIAGRRISSIRVGPDNTIWFRSANGIYRFDGNNIESLPATHPVWQKAPPHLWALIPAEQLSNYLCKRHPIFCETEAKNYCVFADFAGAAVIVDPIGRKCHRIAESTVNVALPSDFPAVFDADNTGYYCNSQNTCFAWTGRRLERVAGVSPGTDSAVVYHQLAPNVFHYNDGKHKAFWYREGDRYQRLSQELIGRFNRVDKIFIDSQRRIFIATDEGFAVLDINGLERVELPQARYPWSVLPGGESYGVWIGSLHDGFFQLSPVSGVVDHIALPSVTKVTDDQQVFPGKLRGPDGTLLFGGYKGFYAIKKNKRSFFPLGQAIEALAWDERRGNYLVAGLKVYIVDSSLRTVIDTLLLPQELTLSDGLSALMAWPDGSFWAAGNGGVAHLSANGRLQKLYKPTAPGISLLTDASGRLWVGSGSGLFRYDARADTMVSVLPEVIAAPVNSLVLLPGDTLAVVTDMELLLLDIQAPESVLLAGYWAQSNGFQLLEASENGSSFDGQHLWIPSGTGIQRLRIPLAGAVNDPQARLRIDRIGANYCLLRDTLPTDKVEGRTVEVALSLLNLRAGKYIVEYRLNSGQWIPAEDRLIVQVKDLEHGINQIRFRVKIPGQEERYWPTAACMVSAALHLWEKPIFWVFVILVFSMLSAYSYRQNWKTKKQKKRLLQANLSTTIAQLNPHILFNLLASLQNSIINRSKEEASAHLVQVSKLVRDILELSMRLDTGTKFGFSTITVAQELNFLQNYLELEAMQHHPPFQYSLENALQTPAEALFLPPLLLQPLVENAILHGIRPLFGRSGEIRIRIAESGNYLVLSVEDNGVGINSNTPTSGRHRSRGGQLLQERLDCLHGLGYHTTKSIRPNMPHGTIAEIKIKKMYAHNPD